MIFTLIYWIPVIWEYYHPTKIIRIFEVRVKKKEVQVFKWTALPAYGWYKLAKKEWAVPSGIQWLDEPELDENKMALDYLIMCLDPNVTNFHNENFP